MTFSVIVSTMNQNNYDLLEHLNINSDAIIINQCGKNRTSIFKFNKKDILWIDSDEKGLSKSRNRALKEIKSDIVLMVDDDETLYDNTESIITTDFIKLNADLIAFNINGTRKRYINTKVRKIRIFNAFRYGSARLAFRTDFVKKNNIVLNEFVGAGTPVGCGEDSIFIQDFLKNKGKCYSSPKVIADICDDTSTWFKGYDETFFANKARVLKIMFPRTWKLIALRFLFKHRKKTKALGFFKALESMYSI